MSFRIRSFLGYLIASVIVMATTLGSLYAGWYRWPAWYLVGGDDVALIMVLVDLALGPLAVLLVSDPGKPRAVWQRDLVAIVLVQASALAGGIHTLWTGRPLYFEFSMDRIEVVQAAVFDEDTVNTARLQGARIIPGWQSLPQWIWAPLPEDAKTASQIVLGTAFGGQDVTAMPQYFRPWAEGLSAMQSHFRPVKNLVDSAGLSESEYQQLLADLGRPEEELVLLPVQGRRRTGYQVLLRETGEPLRFVATPATFTR